MGSSADKLRHEADEREQQLGPERDSAYHFLIDLADRVEGSRTILLDGTKAMTTRETVLVELALRDYAQRFRRS